MVKETTPTRIEAQVRTPLFKDIEPRVEAGPFTLYALSTSPAGFDIKTHSILSLRGEDGYWPKSLKDFATATELDQIKSGIQGDMYGNRFGPGILDRIGFKHGEVTEFERYALDINYQQIEKQLRSNHGEDEPLTPEEQAQLDFAANAREHALKTVSWRKGLKEMTPDQRSKYVRRMLSVKKYGFVNAHIKDNTIETDVVALPFHAYQRIKRPTSEVEAIPYINIAGTAMILKTSDGKLVVQHRSFENNPYGDIPGASVAGLFDAQPGKSERGKPAKVTTKVTMDNAADEGSEEIGLSKEYIRAMPVVSEVSNQEIKDAAGQDFSKETGGEQTKLFNVKITGIAGDNVRIHDELTLYGETTYTAEELQEVAREAKNQTDKSDVDFRESFFYIDATPEAIETLLCEIKCPLPPTHAAAFLAAGYNMVIESDGIDQAEQWLESTREKIKKNWELIDAMTPTGKYDPSIIPEMQGLPLLDDELARTGIERTVDRKVGNAYLFDVDGVITDPNKKEVLDDGLFDELIKRLEVSPICFNSGRPIDWITTTVIEPLKERIRRDKKSLRLLSNLFLIGEMGGSYGTFDRRGNLTVEVDDALVPPRVLEESVTGYIANNFSAESMKIDPRKQTMITIEKEGMYPQEIFDTEKIEIRNAIDALIQALGLQDEWVAAYTTIAVDIQNVHAGKAKGIPKFLEWLATNHLIALQFNTFGDSESDTDMALALNTLGKNVKHTHVGNKLSGEFLEKNRNIVIEEPTRRFSQTTLDHLRTAAV